MFARFVWALLGFCAREFTVKSGKKPWTFIVDRRLYDTVRTRTVLPLHQIKTAEMEIKGQNMVHIKNTPVENYGYRMNPDSYSGIYMTSLMEYQCRIVAEDRRKTRRGKRKCETIQFCQKGSPHHQVRELM